MSRFLKEVNLVNKIYNFKVVWWEVTCIIHTVP